MFQLFKNKKILFLGLSLFVAPSLFAQTWSKDLEKKAKKGNAQAQYEVGMCYLNGSGTGKDLKKAAKWFNLATCQGNKEAKERLFASYSKELEKLAKKNDADAQYALGMCYLEGRQTAKDLKKAAQWFSLATSQGHQEAQKQFFASYSKELEKMAKKKNPDAQYALGMCYYEGRQIARDTDKAGKWFYRAKEQGHQKAMEMFYSFNSLKRRFVTQRLWLNDYLHFIGEASYFNIKDGLCIFDFCQKDRNQQKISKINITGYRKGEDISQATVTFNGLADYLKDDPDFYRQSIEQKNAELRLVYKGDCMFVKSGNDYILTLNPGGEIVSNTHQMKLAEAIVVRITCNENTEPKISYQVGQGNQQTRHIKKVRQEKDKEGFWNELLSSPYDAPLHVIDNICPFDTLEYTAIEDLTDKNSLTIAIASTVKDSIYLGNHSYLYPQKDLIYFTDKRGYSIQFDSKGLSGITKSFKDCFMDFQFNQPSTMTFTNGDYYYGYCILNDLKGHYLVSDDNGYNENWMKDNYVFLKYIWSLNRFADLDFYIADGIYTTSKGDQCKWYNGYSTEQIELAKKLALRKQAINQRAIQKEYKAKAENAKRQLLAEGFNPREVSQLIDHCNIYVGMSKYLVERATQLNSNVLKIHSAQLGNQGDVYVIEIINPQTGETDFSQIIQYNYWTDRVAYVGSSFP